MTTSSPTTKPKILLLMMGGSITMVKDKTSGLLVPSSHQRDLLKIAPELKEYFSFDVK